MTLFEWNVVVVGAWNPAILTPAGIAQRIFELPTTTPIQVLVPIDGRAPTKVIHAGLEVMASAEQLIVSPSECSPAALQNAGAAAARAIKTLPITPFTAAGINVRTRYERLPSVLLDGLDSTLDNVLGERYKLESRALQRAIEWDTGTLNLRVEGQDGGGTIQVNFHLQSSDEAALRTWLCRAGEFANASTQLIAELGVGDE